MNVSTTTVCRAKSLPDTAMRERGVEPLCPKAPDPKRGADGEQAPNKGLAGVRAGATVAPHCTEPQAGGDFSDNTAFFSRASNGAGCWEWQGHRNEHGYGRFKLEGRSIYAHRRAWELTRGTIPAGANVCHTCDNPACVRPDHLWLGTQGENIRDMVEKGRARNLRAERQRAASSCKRGHAFTADNTRIRDDGSRACKACQRVRRALKRAA